MKTNKEIYEENNLFIQPKEYQCGPSSIINIQRMFGLNESSLQKIENLTGAKPKKGTTNNGITYALKKLGFETYEHKDAGIDLLETYLAKNFFAIVNYCNALHSVGHYAVVESTDENSIYLRDSSLGFLRINKKSFDGLWHDMSGTASRWFVAIKPKHD